MSKIAIRAENLSKQYRIGGNKETYRTLRDTLADAFTAPFRRVGKLLRGHAGGAAELDETIWALKEVSFEIKRGEVVGIIGHNGAGKSTLLKILSRITEPTGGYVDIYGRVGSLLEVGTGFHAELTGRENVYLNGAILGMKRGEIDRKFDEIVAFAELNKFIDTPVKHYSTGMYLRLAFAVAAHLEPEILLVDEVLAVGDASFQKKCLGKMDAVAREGRTVLFVSHNMAAVQQLTSRALLLTGGRIVSHGPTPEVINSYLNIFNDRSNGVYDVRKAPRRYPFLRREVELLTLQFETFSDTAVPADADLSILICVRGNEKVDRFGFMLTIYRYDGVPVGNVFSPEIHSLAEGEIATFRMVLSDHRLARGKYQCKVQTGKGNHLSGLKEFDAVFNVLHFEVMAQEVDGVMARWYPNWGCVRFKQPAIEKIT